LITDPALAFLLIPSPPVILSEVRRSRTQSKDPTQLRAIKDPNGNFLHRAPLIIATLDRSDWEEICMIAFLCALCG
jgi:hypothetical protein